MSVLLDCLAAFFLFSRIFLNRLLQIAAGAWCNLGCDSKAQFISLQNVYPDKATSNCTIWYVECLQLHWCVDLCSLCVRSVLRFLYQTSYTNAVNLRKTKKKSAKIIRPYLFLFFAVHFHIHTYKKRRSFFSFDKEVQF